jgi:hypothetical protein
MSTDSTTVKRFGITVGNRSMPLGYWPAELNAYGDKSFVGIAKSAMLRAVQHAQRHHELTEEQKLASQQKRVPKIPDIAARQTAVKQDKQVAELLRKQISQVELSAFDFEIKMRVKAFEYDPSDGNDRTRRSELRAVMRGMDDKGRNALLAKSFAARRAAVEGGSGHEILSGISPLQRQRMVDDEIRGQFPTESKTVKDTATAVAAAKDALKALEAAVESEYVASGAADTPETETKPARQVTWTV